ncbi:MAG TPA: hypothetical protein VK590_04765, partial [Saprospiraceae bacterium]|nr:hypothetical protein [Saprospiraceae bacterium]
GEEMSQEQKQQMDQVDQMVKDKVTAFKTEKDNECKAKAMEAAKMKADSTIKAMEMTKKGTVTKVVKKTTVKKVTKPATVGNGKPKLGGGKDDGTVGNGKPKLGEPDKKDAKKDDGTTVGNGKPKLGGK